MPGDPSRPSVPEPFGANARGVALAALYAAWAFALAFFGQPVLGPLSGLVLLELALVGYRRRVVRGKVVDDPALLARVAKPLEELCHEAEVAVPRVVIMSNGLRSMGVGRRKGHVLLVASGQFLDGLDDRALRAVIAHEVSHLRHGDLQTARHMSLTVLFVAAAAMFLVALAIPNFIDLPVYIAVFATAAIFCRLSLSPLRQRSERRADIYGARLSGDPQALASALVAATRFRDDARRRFLGVGAWRWLLWPLSWRMPSHPSLQKRLTALADLGATLPD
jgi:Zn-dependent protease with chaperone function